MMMRIFVILLIFSSSSVFADELCRQNRIDASEVSLFPKSYEAAADLSEALCLHHIRSDEVVSRSTVDLAERWKKAALEEAGKLKEAGIDITEQINHIYEQVLAQKYVYFKENIRRMGASYRVTDQMATPVSDETVSKCDKLYEGFSCRKVLRQFEKVSVAIKDPSDMPVLEKAYQEIGLYNNAWDDYFTNARSQTFIELSINTGLYKDKLQERRNVLPPTYQVIFMHPSAAIEYVDKAVDAQQQKEALLMEWVGMNWWDWKVPFGFSVISAYTDRAGLDDHALGIMFHFYNNYSIGYTHRSGADGVIVTVDLLKVFEDKHSNLKRYKREIEGYIN